MNPSRRGFILGAGATLLAAPAIVRAASLMPVKNRLETLLTVRDLRVVIDALERNRVVPLPDGSYVAYLAPGETLHIPSQIVPLRCRGVTFVATSDPNLSLFQPSSKEMKLCA